MAIGNSLLRISAQKEVSDFPFCCCSSIRLYKLQGMIHLRIYYSHLLPLLYSSRQDKFSSLILLEHLQQLFYSTSGS